MMQVVVVSTRIVHQTWPKVEAFFDKVAKVNTSYSLEQMRTEIFMGRWALLVATKDQNVVGAMAMQYQNRMNDRVAFVFAVGGSGIATHETWSQVKAIFAENGATSIEAGVRPSALRLWRRLGMAPKYQIAGMKL